MTKHGTILLVEDEAHDALLRKAFNDAHINHPIVAVHSGDEAVKYLSGSGKYADRKLYPLPFLALVDLTTANEAGFSFLRWLYERPGLKKKFTLIVLGTATSSSEIQLTYELGAQSYLLRPADADAVSATVRAVKEYWIELNLSPVIAP